MYLADVLNAPVTVRGERIGFVTDVRLLVPDSPGGGPLGTPHVYGLVICPRRAASYLGFERRDVRAPALLARLFRWRLRGSFLVLWPDVWRAGAGAVELRAGYTRWSPRLPAVD